MNIELDNLYHNVRIKKMTEDEIQKQYYILRGRIVEILSFEDELVFKPSKLMENKASECMATFLKSNYGIEININNKYVTFK